MEPAYKPGDRVVTFNWGKLKGGDVVVFNALTSLRALNSRHPERSEGSDEEIATSRSDNLNVTRNDTKVNMIKRINKIDGELVFVAGDNKHRTSRIDPIRQDQVIGKVILKY